MLHQTDRLKPLRVILVVLAISLAATALLPLPLLAGPTWVYVYAEPYSFNVEDMAACPQGGYAVAGTGFGWNLFLLRVDASGNLLWTKSFDLPNDAFLKHMRVTRDGGFALVGDMHSGVWPYFEDAWIIRVAPSGDILWQKRFASLDGESFRTVCESSDGGILAFGTSAAFGGVGKSWAVKFDFVGDIVWQRNCGAVIPRDVRETGDGGYILVGGDGGQCPLAATGVAKLDSQGQLEWARCYPLGSYACFGVSVAETPDGGYIVGANTENFEWLMDFWLLKLDPVGNIQWQKQYGGWDREFLTTVKRTADGFLLAGTTATTDRTIYDVWVVKVDSQGEILWQRATYPYISGPFAYWDVSLDSQLVVSADQSPDGLFIQNLTSDAQMDISCDFVIDTPAEPVDTGSEPLVITVDGFDTWATAEELGAVQNNELLSQRMVCTSGPYVQRTVRLNSPFRLKLLGINFHPDAEAFIGDNPSPWRRIRVKSDTEILLKGAGLKGKFPRGQEVTIRIRNPDGGETYTSYMRP